MQYSMGMIRSKRTMAATAISALLMTGLHALELAYPFQDNMVVQRGKEVPVWGTAKVGEQVRVDFNGKTAQAKAGADGKWKAVLPAMTVNAKAQSLKVSAGGKSKQLSNVLIGDVWLASGQSNMSWTLRQCATGKAAIAASADDGLRLFNHAGTLHPGSRKYSVDFLKKMNEENYYASKGWQASAPATSASMSGVAYFFGQKLRRELKVPIGLIHVGVGGSPIEAHIAPEVFAKEPKLAGLVSNWHTSKDFPKWCRGRAAHNLVHWLADPELKGKTPPHPFAPTFLWKAGPQRLAPMPIKGVIWYQGESNAGRDGTPEATTSGELNKKKFGMLLESWRAVWGEDLPAYYVQLPGLNRKWPMFREWQLEASHEFKNVGMAVTIDVGHPTNVHPSKKKPVGERLARLALAKTYGKAIVPNGPLYKRSVVKGGEMAIDFENNKGMKASSGDVLIGFEIAGADKKFYTATAKVTGNYIKVSSPSVKAPVAVRYAWDNDPQCNLVNSDGIPASPFRTDKWKEVNPSGNVKKGAAVPLAAKKSSGKIRVACIGDSITFGAGIKDRTMTYPAQLQKMLGDKYEVKNFGNSGRGIVQRSMRGRSKRGYIFMKEHQAALKFEPQIVICNLGINDLGDWNKFGKTDFVKDYIDLLEKYKSLDSYPRIIIWHELAPLFKGQKYFGHKNVGEINKAIGKVAKEMKIETIDMAKPFKGKAAMFPDHIHPNADGATVIAKEVAKIIKN